MIYYWLKLTAAQVVYHIITTIKSQSISICRWCNQKPLSSGGSNIIDTRKSGWRSKYNTDIDSGRLITLDVDDNLVLIVCICSVYQFHCYTAVNIMTKLWYGNKWQYDKVGINRGELLRWNKVDRLYKANLGTP